MNVSNTYASIPKVYFPEHSFSNDGVIHMVHPAGFAIGNDTSCFMVSKKPWKKRCMRILGTKSIYAPKHRKNWQVPTNRSFQSSSIALMKLSIMIAPHLVEFYKQPGLECLRKGYRKIWLQRERYRRVLSLKMCFFSAIKPLGTEKYCSLTDRYCPSGGVDS